MNTPNKLTLLRIILIPVFVGCFYLPQEYSGHVTTIIFILAYVTDILDGYLARKNHQITDFGKLMDPIADKMLSCSALIMLTNKGMIGAIPVIIIIGRELIISGLRLIAASNGSVIAASKWGKAKTVSQCVAIAFALQQAMVRKLVGFELDTILVWLSVLLTVISLSEFVWKNRSMLSANDKKEVRNDS